MDNNIYVYINGTRTSLVTLAASSGISYETILARYKAGVSAENLTADALDTEPVEDSEKAITSGAVYTALQEYLLADHPIGSFYISFDSASPASLFGGTWERVEDTFLLCAGSTYSAGSTGGEAAHTLSNSELPSSMGSFAALRWASNTGESGCFSYTQRHSDRTAPGGGDFGDALYTMSGGGTAHNNMPQYLAVYVWKRTA